MRSDTQVSTGPAMVTRGGIARWDQNLLIPVTMIPSDSMSTYKSKIVKVKLVDAQTDKTVAKSQMDIAAFMRPSQRADGTDQLLASLEIELTNSVTLRCTLRPVWPPPEPAADDASSSLAPTDKSPAKPHSPRRLAKHRSAAAEEANGCSGAVQWEGGAPAESLTPKTAAIMGLTGELAEFKDEMRLKDEALEASQAQMLKMQRALKRQELRDSADKRFDKVATELEPPISPRSAAADSIFMRMARSVNPCSWGSPGSLEPSEQVLLCAKQGDAAGLARMIESGVPLDAVDEARWGALHHASARGHGAVVAVLLKEAGRRVSWSRECNDKTALHLSAASGQYAVVQALVSARAPICATDSRQRTALHYAALGNHGKVYQHLARQGGAAALLMQDEKGLLALDMTSSHKKDKQKWLADCKAEADSGHPQHSAVWLLRERAAASKT